MGQVRSWPKVPSKGTFWQVVGLELLPLLGMSYYHHYCGVGSLEPAGGLPGGGRLGWHPGPVVRLSSKRSGGVAGGLGGQEGALAPLGLGQAAGFHLHRSGPPSTSWRGDLRTEECVSPNILFTADGSRNSLSPSAVSVAFPFPLLTPSVNFGFCFPSWGGSLRAPRATCDCG